jgi:hypothetical protein
VPEMCDGGDGVDTSMDGDDGSGSYLRLGDRRRDSGDDYRRRSRRR